ncbi:MAG: cupin domain-containing protein [Spirochaetales bacterium]|nr:cupin domain-containing protein [Spirochaetales bacterium]
MYKINLHDIPERGVNRSYRPGVSIRYLVLEEFGAPGFEMRYFELEPGASSSEDVHPYEHEVFVVRGRGALLLEGERYPLRPHDAILIEPDERHQLLQEGDEPLGFLCIVPNGVSRSKLEVDLGYPHEGRRRE